jgi:hypothetical protein
MAPSTMGSGRITSITATANSRRCEQVCQTAGSRKQSRDPLMLSLYVLGEERWFAVGTPVEWAMVWAGHNLCVCALPARAAGPCFRTHYTVVPPPPRLWRSHLDGDGLGLRFRYCDFVGFDLIGFCCARLLHIGRWCTEVLMATSTMGSGWKASNTATANLRRCEQMCQATGSRKQSRDLLMLSLYV